MAFTNITEVAQTEHKVYGLSAGALFSIDKLDFNVEVYSKLSGLSDAGVRHINYSPYDKLLMIVYENSNIDFVTDDNRIINLSDIHRKTFEGDKSINGVVFTPGRAYLATGFGVIVVNVDKFEVFDTYVIGDNGAHEYVEDIAVGDNTIYALTAGHIKMAKQNGANLANYQNWKILAEPEESVDNKKLLWLNDTLFLVKVNNKLYKYYDNRWSGPTLNVSSIYYDNGVVFSRSADNVTTAPGLPALNLANDATFDSDNNAVWYSTPPNITRIDLADNSLSMFGPNGPASNMGWEFAYHDNRMMVVSGGRWATEYRRAGHISYLDNGSWHVIWEEFLANVSPTKIAKDLVDIAIDPADKSHFFVASYGMGLFEFRNDQLYKLYNVDVPNTIESIYPDGSFNAKYNYQRVDALQFDPQGNLWMFNYSENPLKMIDKQGKFHYFDYAETMGVPTIEHILVSTKNPNIKIVSMPRYLNSVTTALFVFDDNGTIDNVDDDRTKLITDIRDQDGRTISLSQHLVRCIAQDKNGVVWVGCKDGIFLLNNIDKIFDADYRCSKIKIPRNDGTNLADFLLETEEIKDIAVDGANRKWIGTQNSGLYLVSEDGLRTIHHFTPDNSPLPVNDIMALEINAHTGELFIGTGKGIMSYQSDSNEGGEQFSNVHAFPNPVRPDFRGMITITGLTDNTNVRITDVNGNMVFETRSYGGYATWNGCRSNGDRVATGIYFAHCVSEDRGDKAIVKIMVIN